MPKFPPKIEQRLAEIAERQALLQYCEMSLEPDDIGFLLALVEMLKHGKIPIVSIGRSCT